MSKLQSIDVGLVTEFFLVVIRRDEVSGMPAAKGNKRTAPKDGNGEKGDDRNRPEVPARECVGGGGAHSVFEKD